MKVELNLVLDYNPETQECKVVKATPVAPKVTVNNDTAEPTIVLDSNKYLLNEAAVKALGISAGDKVAVQYKIVDGVKYPIIGSSAAFGIADGNKLTKGLTVSCRGKQRELLAEYGTTFNLSPYKGVEGLFVLLGDAPPKPIETVVEDEIEVIEDSDVDLDIEEEDTFAIDDLDFNND